MSLLAPWARGPGRLLRCQRALLASGVGRRGAAGAGQSQPEQQFTICRQQDGIRTIILNNPKKRNALSLRMLKSLQNDILHDAENKDLRVIIISAEGPVFSSGHDLKELTEQQGQDYHAEVFQTCAEIMMLIQKHPVPIIAKVNGLATAAGCQLVASCDIALASEKSCFATPGVNIGLFCSTPAVALGRAVPKKISQFETVYIPDGSHWISSAWRGYPKSLLGSFQAGNHHADTVECRPQSLESGSVRCVWRVTAWLMGIIFINN
ncbi:enoyl-CoA hydratase domain-containing protein 3, mitochondrial isoform X2 [Sminthopsis crassicaudata]|uniref:enoyl-CoA hydratase domain-containing protein 3, mitochondrial isoform X2 n=1 Tax=Sminthopsis crassicaudata TaxID=9301 RepID=UPI003D684040